LAVWPPEPGKQTRQLIRGNMPPKKWADSSMDGIHVRSVAGRLHSVSRGMLRHVGQVSWTDSVFAYECRGETEEDFSTPGN